MCNRFSINFLLAAIAFFTISYNSIAEPVDECLIKILRQVDSDTTKEQIFAQCRGQVLTSEAAPHKKSLTGRRITAEKQALGRGFQITAHRPNYLLPLTYNDKPNSEPFTANGGDSVDEWESIIQVSVKVPIVQNIFNTNSDLFFAYTNKAWWQSYNDEFSKPFRETNYEPELFVRNYEGFEFLGIKLSVFDLGYVHQSNGRSNEQGLSRSWDRLFATAIIDLSGDVVLAAKSWYRLPEGEENDEMKNAYQYLGYGELRLLYAPNKNTFSAMYRPGTKKSAVEITWSHPISDNVRFYAAYFNGYGENLLDYNAQSDRFGIGFAINDYVIGD